MTWLTLWKYRKYIGLALLLMAVIIIYNIHKRSLIDHGYQVCVLENETIIRELKEKSENEIINIRNEFERLNDSIDAETGGSDLMPVSSRAIIRMFEHERNSR